MKQFLCCLLVLAFTPYVNAQVYNITKYSREDGLAQSQVMALLQDHRGYLWLGTHTGVDKFDGRNFDNLLDELSGRFISALQEDQQGGIWIASESGLDYHNGLQVIPVSQKQGIGGSEFTALGKDLSGNIWVGTKGSGIWVKEQESFSHHAYDSDSLLTEAIIQAILGDSKGNVWIGTRQGLFIKEPGKDIKAFRDPTLAGAEIYVIFESSSGEIWVGTDYGLVLLNNPVQHTYLNHQEFADVTVYAIVEDEHQQLWFGTGNGLGRMIAGNIFPFQPENELLNTRFTGAIKDIEGNLWFSSDGGGIRRITEGIFNTFAGKKYLSSNLAKSFLEDEEGRIWVSTKDRGINILKNGKLVQSYTEIDGLGGPDICSSFKDSKGNFWFASYSGTLTRYRNGTFTVYGQKEGLLCSAVYWVSEDHLNNLWIATDQGIYIYSKGKIVRNYSKEDGLPSQTVFSLLPNDNGKVWIGTTKGLALYEKGKIAPFDGMGTDGKEAIGSNVITLLEDNSGRTWVGSAVGLACIIDGKPNWVKISGTRGAHTVVSLALEADKYLWVGTENGAYRLYLPTFNPSTKNTFDHFIEKDGLLSKECNANAILQDSKGGIWIGTSEGAVYRPKRVIRQDQDAPPLLYITRILDTEPEVWIKEYRLDSMNLPIGLSLPYTRTRVDFEFIGISLKSPEQVEYRYKLEGVDKDWQKPTHNTSVFYPNLDPGNYTFRLTAKRETEKWNYDYQQSYPFTITPPVWQKAWFILLILALLLGIAYYFYLNYSNRRKQQIEEQKIRNTAEKLQLEHQALYAMMNPHFTFNALQSIQNFIQRNDKKTAHKFLSSFAKLVRKNLDSTKVDYISLGEEIDRLKLYIELEKMRFPEKFDYRVNIDPELDLSETKLPPMVLQPFVENSIKHGIMSLERDGLIEINIKALNEDYLNIDIRDNGIGIEASKKRRRNRPSDHVSKGMEITKDRLALFARMTEKEYELDISEEKDSSDQVQGTLVHMTLPMHVGPLEFVL